MQVPHAKPGKYTHLTPDPMMTRAKLIDLENQLEELKAKRPNAAAEVARLAELGDFSENAEYQLAKSRLRGINNAIIRLGNQINQAEIIQLDDGNLKIQVGNSVVVEVNGNKKTFQILGSTESNPQAGIISYQSPLGKALVGREVGENISLHLGSKDVVYKILEIK